MFRLVSKLFGKTTNAKSLTKQRRRSLRVEALEDRCVPAVLFVDPSFPFAGSFKTITAAVAAAHPGDTIDVGPGTYHEIDIDLNKAGLTIIGGQVRFPTLESPGPSILESTGIGFDLDANNVTVEGMRISGITGIQCEPGFSGFHILGNTFFQSAVSVSVETALQGATTSTISGNNFFGGGSGPTAPQTDILVGGAGASNVVISHNHFVNAAESIASISVDAVNPSTNIQVLNNSITSDAGIQVVNAADVKIDGNYILDPLTTAITLGGGVSNSQVDSNTIIVAPGSSPPTGINGVVLDVGFGSVLPVDTNNVILGNSISGVTDGILLSPANNTKITGNTVMLSVGDGIDVPGGTGTTLTSNLVMGSGGNGIRVAGSNSTLTGNVSEHNKQDGILLAAGSGTTATGNTADFNGSSGIEVNGGGDTISSNAASFNSSAGILVDASGIDNTLKGNVAQLNLGVGFQLASGTQADTLTGNRASGNFGGGFDCVSCSNITLSQNVALDNQGTGFVFFGDNDVLTGNTAVANTGRGFQLSGNGCIVKANVATDNAQDGFFIENGTFTVTDNTAEFNGADGIELFEGTVSKSLVSSNRVLDNLGDGIQVGGSGNTITLNTALGNGLPQGGFDLFDDSGTTTANTWSKNTAHTRNPLGLG
jgi:parallel beta-helix repeat protein